MEKSVFFDHIRTRYGFIKRCRGPYLYTSKDVRLIDMYQEGGGHCSAGVKVNPCRL